MSLYDSFSSGEENRLWIVPTTQGRSEDSFGFQNPSEPTEASSPKGPTEGDLARWVKSIPRSVFYLAGLLSNLLLVVIMLSFVMMLDLQTSEVSTLESLKAANIFAVVLILYTAAATETLLFQTIFISGGHMLTRGTFRAAIPDRQLRLTCLWSVILSASLFALVHGWNATPFSWVSAFARIPAGIVFGLFYWLRMHLGHWDAFATTTKLHFCWNFAIFIFVRFW